MKRIPVIVSDRPDACAADPGPGPVRHPGARRPPRPAVTSPGWSISAVVATLPGVPRHGQSDRDPGGGVSRVCRLLDRRSRSTRTRRGRWCCPGWPSSPASVPTTVQAPTPASARTTSSAAATPSPSPAPPRRWWPTCTRCCRRPRSPAPTSWRPTRWVASSRGSTRPPTPTRWSAWSSSTPTPSGWRL